MSSAESTTKSSMFFLTCTISTGFLPGFGYDAGSFVEGKKS
jgi:hypothetical protein